MIAMHDLNDLNDRLHEVRTKTRRRLSELAAGWKTAAACDVVSRHEYQPSSDAFFSPPIPLPVVQVDQVVHPCENSDLPLNDLGVDWSFKSFSPPSGGDAA